MANEPDSRNTAAGRRTTPPTESSLLDILEDRARTVPDRQIFCFLEEGEVESERLTYRSLERRSQAIAARLQQSTSPGDRVILLYAPGLEFIAALFGCFYAGTIAVPVQPPRLDLLDVGFRRLAGIAANCQPTVTLTGGPIAESITTTCQRIADLQKLPLIITDHIAEQTSADYRRQTMTRDMPALLQYTSGSTGDPKGVVITHGNILSNSYVLQLAFHHRSYERPGVGVCWLPFYHDMGLIGNVLQALYVDGPCFLMSPLTLLQRPLKWLEAISRYQAYSSGGPNFAYDLCVRRVTAEQKKTLDLSSWELAAIGAEPISASTMDRFVEAFAECGFRREAFYPCYGLAEATLFVSGGDKESAPVVRRFRADEITFAAGQSPCKLPKTTDVATADLPATVPVESIQMLVGCGHSWTDHELLIVDPVSCTECAPQRVGEIWFRGSSVASGYWGRPEETAATFDARRCPDGRGPYLRTGDLGFLADGELFISGRLKDLIVIRGQNHFPQDIEETVATLHPAFRPNASAACSCPMDGEERLVILQEIDRRTKQLGIAELKRIVRKALAERHQLQAHDIIFLRNGSLPKTTSGKIQRHECRQRYMAGQFVPWSAKAPS
jgi:acyl-CoA synthetase (AMP-forming)/AMP-acid ligase II